MLLDYPNKLHRPLLMTGIKVLVACIMSVSAVLTSAVDKASLDNNLVIVRGYANSEIISTRNGLVVNSDTYNGLVLTNADLFADVETFTVIDPRSGAELIAQLVWMDSRLDVAIIKANGLNLPAIVFSNRNPGEGELVTSVYKSVRRGGSLSIARGIVRRTYPWATAGQNVNLFIHDAGLDDELRAMLILNECGQLAGLNLPDDSTGLKKAITGRSLRSVLAKQKIITSVATERCLSPIERAQKQAELATVRAQQATDDVAKAEEDMRKLSSLLDDSKRQSRELKLQTGRAELSAEKALEEVNRFQHEISLVREEATLQTQSVLSETQKLLEGMDQAHSESESNFRKILKDQEEQAAQREKLTLAAIVFLFAALIFMAFVMRRRQTNLPPEPSQSQDEQVETLDAESPSQTILQQKNFAEYVLDGKDDGGIRYMLRISSDQLNTPDGVVIGRNPVGSSYVINHVDVSRNHARMRIMKNRLFIEDMDSTNGTIVNGQSIGGRGLVSISEGDQIIIGSIVMSLRVLQAA